MVEDERGRAMPSRRALLGAGRYDLHHAVLFWGGYVAVRVCVAFCGDGVKS